MQAAPLADAVVFAKVKARLGGRVRLVASGSAPLAGHVEEFLKTVMCAPVAQGYGLTETCGSSFIALPEAVRVPMHSSVHNAWYWPNMKLRNVSLVSSDAASNLL